MCLRAQCSFVHAPSAIVLDWGDLRTLVLSSSLSHRHTVISEGLRETCPRRDGSGQSERGGGKRATQIWSSMGKTNRVPRLNSSWSRESSSRSRASSEVLPILLLFAFRPDPAAVLPDAPLAARAASPNVKVRSLSLQRQSESWSFSCSWFWKWQGQRRWGDAHAHTQMYYTQIMSIFLSFRSLFFFFDTIIKV